MKFLDLRRAIEGNIFTLVDILKYFPNQSPSTIRTQLGRFIQRGLLVRIKRGLYCFDQNQIDELDLASRLYQPSYISLETALNFYGLIPDIPQSITSVTVTTTKQIRNQFGIFSYTKIKPKLFFGFVKAKSANSDSFFNLAQKEKALLDYFYLRKVKTSQDLRLNLTDLDQKLYRELGRNYPQWVQKVR